jgi:hypothetical protein
VRRALRAGRRPAWVLDAARRAPCAWPESPGWAPLRRALARLRPGATLGRRPPGSRVAELVRRRARGDLRGMTRERTHSVIRGQEWASIASPAFSEGENRPSIPSCKQRRGGGTRFLGRLDRTHATRRPREANPPPRHRAVPKGRPPPLPSTPRTPRPGRPSSPPHPCRRFRAASVRWSRRPRHGRARLRSRTPRR